MRLLVSRRVSCQSLLWLLGGVGFEFEWVGCAGSLG